MILTTVLCLYHSVENMLVFDLFIQELFRNIVLCTVQYQGLFQLSVCSLTLIPLRLDNSLKEFSPLKFVVAYFIIQCMVSVDQISYMFLSRLHVPLYVQSSLHISGLVCFGHVFIHLLFLFACSISYKEVVRPIWSSLPNTSIKFYTYTHYIVYMKL